MTGKGLLRGIFISVIAVILPLGDTVSASEKVDMEGYQKFGSFLSDFRKEQSIRALTAVIVKDGEVVWEQALGTSDDEGDVPATMDTTFGIASVTKPIAATAILAEAGKGGLYLDWLLANDPRWADFCGWFSTSGIPFGGGGKDSDGTAIEPVDCERKLSLLDSLNMRVNGAAGSAFVYNPMTYARIDRAIEGAGGRPLRAIVRDNVLKKAGMENVALGWHDPDGGSALRLLAPPFTVQEDGRDIKASHSDDDFRAAAGIIASARHVAQFDIALDAGKLLSADWMGRIFSDDKLPPRGDYRWGWFAQDWQDKRLYWHSGWEPDRYSAIYLKIPEKRLTLILLANNENLWWGNPFSAAEIHKSPVVAEFLTKFAAP
ncbi:serine hydrolase domain-containing protein [Parasphingorhabdus cellanae]|uniref:Beta-lactamase family protein n=1 Tax=Parasphingorhabdus cellanae TaxID=2806553 RepID=A0ABX7T2B5_9SPHN|nr:serine hydrolase domain-containing protein [Parasphingorhabdus cellanae]QTD54677.1 beta-lactamase family protein [Parasphingorhabdus cellanae]